VAEVTLLLGRDRGLARRALTRLLKDAGVDPDSPDVISLDGRRDTLADAREALRHPAWTEPRRVVVLWELTLGPTVEGLDVLENWASDPRPNEGWLILWAPEADRRIRAVRALEKAGATQPVAPMNARQAALWLRRHVEDLGAQIDEGAASEIVAMVGSDADALEQEAEKLYVFTDGGRITSALVAAATTGNPNLSVFRLTEAVSRRRIREALPLVRLLLDRGEEAVGLVALLAREIRLIARTKDLQAQRLPLDALGLRPFILERLAQVARLWSGGELRQAVGLLLEADRKIKTGHRPDLALELCLIDLVEDPDARGRAEFS